MSDSDSFIEEVTEEVRRDQLYKYVRKYGWIAVVLVVGAVGVTGFLEWQKASLASDAQARGDQFAAALDAEDPAARADALAALTDEAGPAAVIVQLRRAAELTEAGDVEGAVAAYDAVAGSDAGPVYTELARLKSVILQGAEMDASARASELEALAAPGAIYRPLALEQQAIAALAADDRDTAIALYSEIPAMSQLLSE